jgi:rhamnose utilization protein RhaD (predicted bifunctional aldolase and dehydrogenase)
LTKADVAICHTDNILALLNRKNPGDEAIDKTLFDARVNGAGKKPSVEAMFHAWLLTLPGINFVGHCHPQTVNQVLCSPRAREFAERRSCPDEVVCCGPASVFVPYADPGLALALEIRKRTVAFIRQSGFTPRLIVLQNHGIIALGGTPQAVLACLLMTAKAAAIFVGAAQLGGPNFMVAKEVRRIFSRADEAYRQRQLKI